jgi:glucose/mannose transport system substrate-binding protein
MAASTQVKEAFFQVINTFFTHPDQTAVQATRQLDAALSTLQ